MPIRHAEPLSGWIFNIHPFRLVSRSKLRVGRSIGAGTMALFSGQLESVGERVLIGAIGFALALQLNRRLAGPAAIFEGRIERRFR